MNVQEAFQLRLQQLQTKEAELASQLFDIRARIQRLLDARVELSALSPKAVDALKEFLAKER